MEDATDTTRYPRTLTATDTEWRRIRERADAAGIPISRFICQCAAGPEPRPRGGCFARGHAGQAGRTSRPRCWPLPRSSGSASPSAARPTAGRRRCAGWRSGCARNGRTPGRPGHDPRPAPQHLLQPGRVGGDRREGRGGGHEHLRVPDRLRAGGGPGRAARHAAGADGGRAEDAVQTDRVYRPLGPGDVRADAGIGVLDARCARLSETRGQKPGAKERGRRPETPE